MTHEREGALLVDKPSGPTSHDVVRAARKALGIRRIGHTGTLDPFATGLLILLVGSLTRLAEFFHLLPKVYHAVVRLGADTTTDDVAGDVIRSADGPWPTPCLVERAVSEQVGLVRQVPPAFSAKRVEGTRAHRLARRGETPELDPVEVQIHALEVQRYDPPDLHLTAVVSTGTYVRAIARDLGGQLGVGGHLRALRRTRIGPFGVETARPLSALGGDKGQGWREPVDAVGWLPRRALDHDETLRIERGQAIPRGLIEPPADLDGSTSPEPLPVALVREASLVAIASVDGDRLRPRKVFPSDA